MKSLIRKIIAFIGRFFGVAIHIQLIGNRKTDLVLVDRYTFSPFLLNDDEVVLYNDAMQRADGVWSDNFYKQCRYYSLCQLAKNAAGQFPDLDIAECGVWKGHSAYMISKIFSENHFTGKFHIFDSFEGGLSDKVEKDRNLVRYLSDREIKLEKEIFSSREDEVKSVLADYDFVSLYPGWIPERFAEVSDRKFSFVHIDVDLYEPTLSSLEFFWPRLAEGGVVVIDDYGSSQFPGASTAVDEFLADHAARFFYKVPLGACFIIK
jgi:hypothetical protein